MTLTERISRARHRRPTLEVPTAPRIGALLGTLGLLAASLVVFAAVMDLYGSRRLLYLVVLATLAGATLLVRVLTIRQALLLATALLVGGLSYYGAQLGVDLRLVGFGQHSFLLLTGTSIQWIPRVDLWVLGFVPAPVFAAWFLALKGAYGRATIVGGLTLAFLVLTGDAAIWPTLLGVVSGGAVLAFGDLAERDATAGPTLWVLVVLGLLVLAPFVLPVVPGGSVGPINASDPPVSNPTMEESLVGAGSSFEIEGAVNQTPEVRFVVNSTEPQYWKTSSYDRYTGNGWERTVDPDPYSEGDLVAPKGNAIKLEQVIEPRVHLSTLPAAWRPVSVDENLTADLMVTETGDVRLNGTLEPGERYSVTSRVPNPLGPRAAIAEDDYPEWVTDRYTQLPETTPDRVGDATADLINDTESPYEAARVVETWLEANKAYSLDVEPPDGDLVDSFLFEMEAGYCSYHATAMVGMLRSVDIPARLAVGYTSGEEVEEGRWLVRGVNSHAWVEVYLPDIGWIAFDPTPSGPREDTEAAAILEGRENGSVQVDLQSDGEGTDDGRREIGSFPETDTGQSAGPDTDLGSGAALPNETQSVDSPRRHSDPPGLIETEAVANRSIVSGDGGESPLPFGITRLQLALAGILIAGGIAGVRTSGLEPAVRRQVAIRFQRRVDPETDVERAKERLLLLLEREHRARKPGETMRQYLDAIDAGDVAHRVGQIHERARYANEVSPELADEAVELVDELR